jgi:type IV secretion system protein TrbL
MDITTEALLQFHNAFTDSISTIKPVIYWLFMSLITIDLLLSILLNLGDTDIIKQLIQKTLKYGIFYYVIYNYAWLTNIIITSCGRMGLMAGGYGADPNLITDPGKIAQYGLHIAGPILDFMNKKAGPIGNAMATMMPGLYGIAMVILIMILGAFFLMAIEVFITYLETFIVGVIALILIPFGANRYTSIIGQKAANLAITYGIKY